MPQCAVITCRNSHRKTKGRRVRYHRFPAEDDVRTRWVWVCGRGLGKDGFNAATARVCSLHFSPQSYERDVEHEILGLPPRGRLRKGAVPDLAVPVTLPSLVKRIKQRHKQQVSGKLQQYTRDVTARFDVPLALGLTPTKQRQDAGYCIDLNRMHVMEDCTRTTNLDPDDLTTKPGSGSPKSCEDSGDQEGKEEPLPEKEPPEEEDALDTDKDPGLQEDEPHGEDCKENKDSNNAESVSGEISDSKAEILEEKLLSPAGCGTDGEKGSVEFCESSKQQPDLSLPPSPEEEEDNNMGTSSPGSQEEPKMNCVENNKRTSSDSDSDTPSVVKKMKLSKEEFDERERTVSEYVESAAGTSVEELQRCTDKLQQEIETLHSLARTKEHEWNDIIRLKKVKEEMFLRLQRKRHVMLLMMGPSKVNDTLDWDLSSEMKFGECSVGDNGVSARGKSSESGSKSSNASGAKEQSTRPQFQPSSTAGPNNHGQLPLMMVPIVSSSPGNLSISCTSQASSHSLRVPDPGSRDKPGSRGHRPILPKPSIVMPAGTNGQNPVIGEGRQGPILDVRSIIADYRSRHPEMVPRRGRRLKSSLSPTPTSQLTDNLVTSTRVSGGGGILSMASLALGSGSHVRTGLVGSTSEMGDLSFLLGAVGADSARQDSSRPSSADSSRSGAPSLPLHESTPANRGISFKDVLVQFAKLSQTERHEPLQPPTNSPSRPPPYPEVTLHPVLAPHSPPQHSPSSSLLHGILTKSANTIRTDARPTTFSPTLARLLTAPERLPSNTTPAATATFHGSGQVSISDLLSTSKTRNEITITPVTAQPSMKPKEDVVLLEEEEQEDSADRLVIDESGDGATGREEGEEDQGAGQEISAEDVPECQGCHQRAAQFVCAGCGNQWYCSRDCQVTAWDEHSEVCSG